MALTIVSIGRITSTGYSVAFEQKSCKIKNKSGKVVGDIPASSNGLYKVEHSHTAASTNVLLEQVDIHMLHQRLGHISADAICSLIWNNAIEGVQLIDDGTPIICNSCQYAKLTRKPIRSECKAPPANCFGVEIHSDLWGPSPVASLGGHRYYVTFTDDHTHFTRVDILQTKDQTLNSYHAFTSWARTQHSAKIKALRLDRSGEYTSRKFTHFLQSEGTERRLTTHDTPQHNGIAESLNRRLLEHVRAILHQSGLPKQLWAEALQFVVWLKNHTSTRALGNNTMPFEKLYGSKPNLSGIPEWGQAIWVHSGTGSKLDACGIEARWVRYNADSTHAHRIYWPYKNSVSIEHNIKFTSPFVTVDIRQLHIILAPAPTPAQAPVQPPVPPAPPAPSLYLPAPVQLVPASSKLTQPPSEQASRELAPQVPGGMPLSRVSSCLPSLTPSPSQEEEEEFQTPTWAPHQQEPPPPPPKGKGKAKAPQEPTRRTTRIPKPTYKITGLFTEGEEPEAEEEEPLTLRGAARREIHYNYLSPSTSSAYHADLDYSDFTYLAESEELMHAAISKVQDDPKTLKEAQSCSDWPKWQEAMDREIATLEEAGTWNTVPRPAGKNIVGSKWVFRIKRKADSNIKKYKARLVARRFTQKFGVDYFDTFSPVAWLASFRTILAFAARNDWNINTFDFNGVYLNGELSAEEDIYMQAPPRYETQGESVKHLCKSLYGLKQAGHKWYDTLCRALTDLGFHVNNTDPGIFSIHDKTHITVLAVHVDDCVITGSSEELISKYKRELDSRYSLTDLGPIHWLLGIKVTRNRDAHTVLLLQVSYINTILSRFSLSDAKPVATPIVPSTSYSKTDAPTDANEAGHMKKIPYCKAVSSLMYAAVATHPDITFAISTLSQFLDNPGEAHWEGVKHVFRYLAGTKTHSLTFGNEQHDLLGFTDADGTSQEHRHAISGFTFLIDGRAVSWASRKQEIITLSTAEAEYVATTHAAKESIWLRRLIGPLFGHFNSPITLFCDNQAVLHLATDDNYHAQTKHIDICYHFIRQTISNKKIKIKYCPTEEMTADILTKALPKFKVVLHLQTLGIRQA
jgi:hypothetical protein